jgi:hypothetical protein
VEEGLLGGTIRHEGSSVEISATLKWEQMSVLALHDRAGNAFELDLTGFEPPQRRWLNVRMLVVGPHGRRVVIEPCLLSKEVRMLARWLDRIAKGRQARGPIGFLEPTLTLEVVASTAESVALRARVQVHRDDITEVTLRLQRSQFDGARDALRRRLDELDA